MDLGGANLGSQESCSRGNITALILSFGLRATTTKPDLSSLRASAHLAKAYIPRSPPSQSSPSGAPLSGLSRSVTLSSGLKTETGRNPPPSRGDEHLAACATIRVPTPRGHLIYESRRSAHHPITPRHRKSNRNALAWPLLSRNSPSSAFAPRRRTEATRLITSRRRRHGR